MVENYEINSICEGYGTCGRAAVIVDMYARTSSLKNLYQMFATHLTKLWRRMLAKREVCLMFTVIVDTISFSPRLAMNLQNNRKLVS